MLSRRLSLWYVMCKRRECNSRNHCIDSNQMLFNAKKAYVQFVGCGSAILSNISGYTGPIFTVFSPYESALRADDGSVLYIPICQGTLPWQWNNITVMKANWYYGHSLHVRQMVALFCFATTLLGGDTAAPSGLLARLCHSFLVFTLYYTSIKQDTR